MGQFFKTTQGTMIAQVALFSLLVGALSAAPQTANEVDTRVVAVSQAEPELLSAAVSSADPDLLRVALTFADPDLLEVALTQAIAPLLKVALSKGVNPDILRTALSRSRPSALAA